MSAFPKADIQNVRIGIAVNVRFWPKADIQEHRLMSLAKSFGAV